MLTGVHFLLTYGCTSECDHCFLYCSPWAEGTFTGERLVQAFDQFAEVPSITNVYFEGGEPFLYYPLLVKGARLARNAGLDVGVVTNCYWATSVEDATDWLRPLAELGISDLSLSDDTFHHSEDRPNPAQMAKAAAEQLGIPVGTICIEPARTVVTTDAHGNKGKPVIGGNVRFRGRAVDKLLEELPRSPATEFTECPDEDFTQTGRIHLDAFGNAHLCQGICLGNLWESPLARLLEELDPGTHPICGPLMRGGPHALAQEHAVVTEAGYVDACHLCFEVRRSLLDRFPETLRPRQVYGRE